MPQSNPSRHAEIERSAYNAEFLANAILAAKQRSELQWAGNPPGFDWGDTQLGDIGV